MTYIKINNTLFPASISGRIKDNNWGDRASKTIYLTMSPENALQIFVNDVSWSIVEEYLDEHEQTVRVEYDNSDYCLAGDIIDHRNGKVSVKMGKLTDKEVIDIITGGN